MATENVRIVKLDTNPAQTSVQELRKELKELRNTLLSTEQGTEEYNQALLKAADIQHTLKEQTEELNASAMDFGQITGNIVKATGGLVAGLQAAKATMNLFGIENEEVLKSLEKMQNLMAITQAIPALDEGIKAFKRLGTAIKSAAAATGTLGKALMASGIGLAVAAVAALAANWDKVKVALGGVNKEYEDILQKRIDEYINRTITALSKQLGLQQKLISIRGGSDVDAAREAVKVYSSAIEEQTKKIDENKKRWEDWNRERGKQARMGNKDAVKQLDAALRGLDVEIKKQEALKNNLELKKQEAEEELEIAKAIEKAQKAEEEEKYKKALEMEMDAAKAILGADKSLQQKLDEKFEGKPIKVPVELKIEEGENNSFDNALAEKYKNKYKNIIEMAKEAAITHESVYEEDLRLLNLALEQKKISLEEYNAYLKQLNAEEVQIQQEKLNIYIALSNAFSDILGSLADSMDESNKEQFEAAKAFNISAAVISTIAGAIGAYTGAASNAGINAIPVVGPALAQTLGIANAAAVAASGAAQIAQLSRKQFDDKNVNGASIAKPNTSAVSSVIAPVQYTQDVQGASIEGAIKDTKVYVTEADITNSQNRVSVTEREARF